MRPLDKPDNVCYAVTTEIHFLSYYSLVITNVREAKMPQGQGLLTNPSPLVIVLTVLIVMFLVFLMAAGGKTFELIGNSFKRLGKKKP